MTVLEKVGMVLMGLGALCILPIVLLMVGAIITVMTFGMLNILDLQINLTNASIISIGLFFWGILLMGGGYELKKRLETERFI